MNSKFLPGLGVLTGTMIGAGFLGIPYVVSKSGFFPGLLHLIFIAVFILFVKLYLGEVLLRTKGNHQLTGYAEKYLGKWGKSLMFFSMVFGIYGALLAYLIAEGKSLSFFIFGNYNYSFALSLGFWFVLTCLSYIGLKALKFYEKIAMILVCGVLIAITVFLSPNINMGNLNYIGNNLFVPFGVILFSFLAFSALPEVRRVLSSQEDKMKKVIITATIIAFAVYLLFTIIVVGVYGKSVNEIATLSLGRYFSILGILTMFTAFFSSTISIRDMFRFDFNMGRFWGWLLASFIPLVLFFVLYFFNGVGFIQILGLAGVISGGLAGILILLMNYKAKKSGNRKPEYTLRINNWVIFILSLIFVIGVVLELIF